jgi:T-complex protein 1 subunit beta
MKAKVAAIASHGITCFVNRQLIYNYPESLLAESGIMAIEHADFEGVERLALVTGGEIASTFDAPDKVKIGRCEVIEEIMIGEDKVGGVSAATRYLLSSMVSFIRSIGIKRHPVCGCPLQERWLCGGVATCADPLQLIKFSGVAAGEACTVVLRGATSQMVEEAERSLHDALSVLSQTVKETRVTLGGGCAEMLMSCSVDEAARTVSGKRALAVEGFSRALRQVSAGRIWTRGIGSQGSEIGKLGRAAVIHSTSRVTGNGRLARRRSARRSANPLQIPTILADNGGYDSSDLVTKLRAAHYEGRSDAGLGEWHSNPSRAESTRSNLCYPLTPLRRHGPGRGRLHVRAGHHRELQAQEAGGRQCERSGRDDSEVSVGDSSRLVVGFRRKSTADAMCRVDNILRSTPRRREGM